MPTVGIQPQPNGTSRLDVRFNDLFGITGITSGDLGKWDKNFDRLVWNRDGRFFRAFDEAEHFQARDVGVHVRVVSLGSLARA